MNITKRITSLLVLLAVFTACSAPSGSSPELIGRTVEYRYGEHVYHVTFDSDSTLHWEAVSGDEAGVRANETYVAEWLSPQVLFITWGEENGVGVSQVLDFTQGKVRNHLLRGREVSKGEGEIRILNK